MVATGVSDDVSPQADVPYAESSRDSSMAGDQLQTRVWIAQVIGNSPTHDQAFNGVQWVCVATTIYTPMQGLNVMVIRVHCVRKCSYMPKRAENELIPAEMRYQPLRAIREGVKCYLGDTVAG